MRNERTQGVWLHEQMEGNAMNVDEIIKAIAEQNAILETWKEDRVEMSNRLRLLEQDISYGEKRRSELYAQLKAAFADDISYNDVWNTETKSQTESDKPQDDDDVYHLVRRPVQIDGVRWAKDADRTLMVTVTDNETHEQQQLFTDNEPCIKACIAGLGNIVDVEYDKNSGELISMIVGE